MNVAHWLAQATRQLTAMPDAHAGGLADGPNDQPADPQQSPRLDSEVLLAHALGCSRTWLYAWPDADLDDTVLATANALLARRVTGEPLAYLTGTREFRSLEFAVSPAVLIPRPDTELLVELALQHLADDSGGDLHSDDCNRGWIIDLGTGSGAVAVSLAAPLAASPGTTRSATVGSLPPLIATDASREALAVARHNAERHCPGQIVFMQGDWLAGIAARSARLIVGNPPYLRADDPHLDGAALAHEPRGALVAGSSGLDDVRRILQECPRVARPGCPVLLEHGFDQAAEVRDLLDAGARVAVSDHPSKIWRGHAAGHVRSRDRRHG